jgi:hypothetical protein
MELSLLCDQVCFLYILDKNQGRVIHFASHPEENFIDMFNKGFTREFYTNDDVSYMPSSHSIIKIIDLPASSRQVYISHVSFWY